MPSTDDAFSLPFDDAISFFRQKVSVTSEHWTDVWREANSRSFTVAGATTLALVEDFRAAIDRAINQGTTLATFRKDFDQIVAKHSWKFNGTPEWRSRVIYETNLSAAYSAGHYAQATAPGVLQVFPYWVYRHSGSVHPRRAHLAWDGLVLRADDAFWTTHYPPNGRRCGCYVQSVSENAMIEMGKAGPDPSPTIEYRDWRNPKTGEVHNVPVGIDPGFDYNPGAAWRNRTQELVRPSRLNTDSALSSPAAATPEAIDAWIRQPAGPLHLGELGPYPSAAIGAKRRGVVMVPESWALIRAAIGAEPAEDGLRALPALIATAPESHRIDERTVLLLSPALAARVLANKGRTWNFVTGMRVGEGEVKKWR